MLLVAEQSRQGCLIYLYKMKILVFGHIPTWAGGRQESGLANVIYQLAYNMSLFEGDQIYLAATDVFVENIKRDRLSIMGWTKGGLIKYAISHPFFTTKWLFNLVVAKIRFGKAIDIVGMLFKGLHLSMSINHINPDFVHLHGLTAAVYEKIVKKEVKLIVTMHGLIGNNKTIQNYKGLSKMEKKVCLSARYKFIGFISNKLVYDFKNLYGEMRSPFKVILNAYDNNKFFYVPPSEHEKPTLLTIASLSDNKGQMRVLEAIRKSGVKFRYICIGAGNQNTINQHENYAKENEIDFDYLGIKTPEEIRGILSEVDFMILPSITEGFGLVFLESIACGVPVILPKHLPIVDEESIIQPGVNSILLNDSSVISIVNCISNLSKNKFDRLLVSRSVTNYSWQTIAQQYHDNLI